MNTGLTIHDQASATDSAWRECGIPINVPAKTMCLVVDTFVLNLDRSQSIFSKNACTARIIVFGLCVWALIYID